MTMKALTEPAARATPARQMRAVVFTALNVGQRSKHENELKKMGFEVDMRDFPRAYNLDAYEVIIVVKDHADNGDKDRAQDAAKRAGKPWFWLTKKLSNPTWIALQDWARRQGLTPVADVDSHPPSFAGRSFASAFTEHMERKVEGLEWEDLAREYEQAALAAAAQTKAAQERYEAAETEVKELRKRLATSAEDGNSTAAQREAFRRDLALAKGESERLAKETAALRDSVRALITDRDDAVRARDRMRRDYDGVAASRDQQTQAVRRLQDELKTAREELQELREDVGSGDPELEAENDDLRKKLHSKDSMLTVVRKERDERTAALRGLQDEIDRLTRELKSKAALSVPAGKRLVSANLAATVEKIWSLVGDGVLEADEAMEKILAQLKGD
jgi:hypothetical protein